MKGLPFTSKKTVRSETFESALSLMPLHDQQVLTELLRDYYDDVSCWAKFDHSDETLTCYWCNASGEDAGHIRHALNCPVGWLQAKITFIEDHLFKLPRLRIGRPHRTTQVIPEEKLLPGSIEDYVDVRRGDAGTR